MGFVQARRGPICVGYRVGQRPSTLWATRKVNATRRGSTSSSGRRCPPIDLRESRQIQPLDKYVHHSPHEDTEP